MRRLPGLPALKVFEAVAQTRSFTRAAERLNLTQSAVSKQIRNLEADMGEALLIRRHHDLELTATGRALLDTIQHLLHELERSLRSISGGQDRLRVNVPPTFAKRWLLPRLDRLRAQLPQTQISISTAPVDGLSEHNLLDCAIRFGDGEWPLLDARRLMTERHVAVASAALLRSHAIRSPADLAGVTLLHVLAADDRRFLTWQHWLDAAGVPDLNPAHGLEFDQLDLSIDAACRGLGVTLADRAMIGSELTSGQLQQLFATEVEGHASYWFVTRPQSAPPRNVERFRDWLFAEIAGP